MRKILYLFLIALVFASCENGETDFDDYDVQAIYFPLQYPSRTLILGESRSDNSIDLQHAFSIGVSIGGMYQNTKDRVVDIALDPTLVEGATLSDGSPIEMLPSEYYTDMDGNPMVFDKIVIPAGSFNGTIQVKLKDEFFNDPLTTGVHYVIPLRILETTKDSVLSGVPAFDDMELDVRNKNHWMAGAGLEPKNFTLFGIKYINKYHGTYFMRGATEELDINGAVVNTTTYADRFVNNDIEVNLNTVSLNESILPQFGKTQGGEIMANLVFNTIEKTIVVESVEGGTTVSGTGTFLEADDAGADVWGGIGHRTIALDYQYDVSGTTFHNKDTLVYRDNDMIFEEFSIVLAE